MNLTKKQWMRSVLCSCAFLAAVCQQSSRLFFHFEDKDRHFMWFAQWEHTNLESLMVEELQHCQRSEVFGHGVLWRRAIWISFPLTLVPKVQRYATKQKSNIFATLFFFNRSIGSRWLFRVFSCSSWFVWFEVEASLISSKRWNDLNVQVGSWTCFHRPDWVWHGVKMGLETVGNDRIWMFFLRRKPSMATKNNCTCNMAVSKLHSKDDCIKFITFHESVLKVNFL